MSFFSPELISDIVRADRAAKERYEIMPDAAPRPPARQARILLDAYAKLSETFDKSPGTLIVQKPGICSGYPIPASSVLIITRRIDLPIYEEESDSNSTHFGRILDIAVLEDSDQGAVEWLVDSRFFEPWKGTPE